MPALKLGVELAGLHMPFRQALHAAAELGVEAVEIDGRGEISPRELSRTGVRQVRKVLEDLRLRVAAVTFRTRHGYTTEDGLDARIAATKAAMDMAHSLGAAVLVNHVGRIPSDPESPSWKLLTDVLEDLGRYGQRAGTMLAAETGTESGEELARLLTALPEGALGVDLNPANLLLGGFSPQEAAAVLGRWITHVHVSDAVGGRAPGTGRPAAVGQGDADFPALLATLEEQGYRGYYTVQQQKAADPVAEISRAIAYLRRM